MGNTVSGRPISRKGDCKVYPINIEIDLMSEIEEMAHEQRVSRSFMVSELLEEAVDARKEVKE